MLCSLVACLIIHIYTDYGIGLSTLIESSTPNPRLYLAPPLGMTYSKEEGQGDKQRNKSKVKYVCCKKCKKYNLLTLYEKHMLSCDIYIVGEELLMWPRSLYYVVAEKANLHVATRRLCWDM